MGEQPCDPQQVAERAVGQLCHAERAEQAVLAQAQIEACGAVRFDADLAAREGQVDSRVQGRGVANLADGLQRRGQVRAVIG